MLDVSGGDELCIGEWWDNGLQVFGRVQRGGVQCVRGGGVQGHCGDGELHGVPFAHELVGGKRQAAGLRLRGGIHSGIGWGAVQCV